MTRRIAPLALAALLALLAGGIPFAGAQEVGAPFVTIDVAPEGAAVAVGERFTGTEMSNTPPVAAGAVGSVPLFVADDGYGCLWGAASASGIEDWIGVARRGLTEAEGTDQCPGFQTKVTTAMAAGADAVIIVNHSPGSEAGTAAAEIPALMIGKEEGDRLIQALDPDSPEAVKVTLESLDPNTFLPPAPVEPTRLQTLSASAGSGTVAVSGKTFFGGNAPDVVAEDPAGDVPFPAALGMDIVQGRIGQPDPFSGDLVFDLDVTDLPASGGIPELVRYNWDFAVDTGAGEAKPFQIDGRLTDVIRRQSQNTPAFVLRGNCVTEDTGITCEDVATLTATMDGAFNRVRVNLPTSVLEDDIGASLQGARIVPADICEGISTKLGAHSTLCNGAGQSTGDIVFQDPDLDVYEVAGQGVEIGIVPAGAAPAYTGAATIGSGGNFTGSLDTSGLAPGTYDVHARACYGTNCDTKTTTITI